MEFVFYGTWTDTWRILKEVLRRKGTRLVADLEYHYPEPMVFRALTASAKELLRKRRRAYVWGDDFSVRPPCLVQQMSGPLAGKHFVYLAGGGPAMELTLPNVTEEEGPLELDAGGLTFPREFWNPDKGRWEKAGIGIKAAFMDLRQRMRGQLEQHFPIKDLWIGPDAWDLVRAGKARVRVLSLPSGPP